MIRQTVHFTGRVQGVGFRFTTCRVARGFHVAGYVQNLPDGRVRCVAEGPADEVAAFIDAAGQAMARHITHTDTQPGEATGEFGDPADPDSFGVWY